MDALIENTGFYLKQSSTVVYVVFLDFTGQHLKCFQTTWFQLMNDHWWMFIESLILHVELNCFIWTICFKF